VVDRTLAREEIEEGNLRDPDTVIPPELATPLRTPT
jgi:hypothetical protein